MSTVIRRVPHERIVRVSGGIELCFEERGDRDAPLVLLVMGLGLDLCWWREEFVSGLAARGLRVVRFDNRDVGRSTQLAGRGPSGLGLLRRRVRPLYTLGEMADDAAGLIEALGAPPRGQDPAPPPPAHVVGASMGALIAQELAIRHPSRVASLVSIMGRPGDPRSGRVARRMRPELVRRAPSDPERAVEHLVGSFRRIGSPGRTLEDDEDVRLAMRRSLRRARSDGLGSGRQLAAIRSERDRTADLAALSLPATVIHGLRDRVIQPSGGRATAAAIPGAELLELPDMGHDLPRAVWPVVQDAIARTVARSSAR